VDREADTCEDSGGGDDGDELAHEFLLREIAISPISEPSPDRMPHALGSGHHVPVALPLLGVVILALEFALAGWLAVRLKAHGRSRRELWRLLPRLTTTWVAVALVVSAVSPTAAADLLGLAAILYLIVVLTRGVRGLPEFARQLWRIGEPDAWRGTEGR
jgi:hypothetical protein